MPVSEFRWRALFKNFAFSTLNMFSEDSAACFEKDEAQSTLTELLEDLNIAAAVVSESCLNELWEAVAISSKAIEKEHQSLPSHEALSKSIEQERENLKMAMEKIEGVKQRQENALRDYRSAEPSKSKIFGKELPAFTVEAAEQSSKEQLHLMVSDYYKFLLAEKKKLQWKKACLVKTC
uniref:Uncharacterized protein n=1 Tax=Ditylenchus dipsaci TaxID=166011 RepID=A0A915E7L3_9BILA